MQISDAKIEYDANGTPRVNGVVPSYRIAKKTPVRNAEGVIVDFDLELEPTNEAARIMVQVSATEAHLNA